MKRMLFHTLLATGLFLLASGNAFAQRHAGGGGHEGIAPHGPANAIGPAHIEQGPANAVGPARVEQGPANAVGPADVEQGPAVRSDVRTNQPAIRNDVRNNDRPNEHPFYRNDRGHDNDWRYGFHDNRWWYWTPGNAWAYWNDGRWQDYSDTAVPYATNYRGPTAPVGWYWNDSQKRYYWFDGTNLTAAQQ